MNQFTYGGMIVVVMGAVMAYLREVPKFIWEFIVRQTTITVTVKDDDPAFDWVKEWILQQKFMKKIRRVDLDSSIKGKLLALLPAPGTHLFWRNRRPFWIHFTRSEDKKGSWEAKRAETLRFVTIGRKQATLEKFVAEIIEAHQHVAKGLSKLYLYGDYWKRVSSYCPRSLEAVILKDDEKQKLIADAREFLTSKERYLNLGIPYHRGYIFYGPPGTGKTSLVSGMASELGMPIYLLNIADLSDKSLKDAMMGVPENSIILFEDIDAAGLEKRQLIGQDEEDELSPDGTKMEKAVKSIFSVSLTSLTGLLNVLDGFHAPSGVIFVMTTNKIDALDDALLRPGRIDYRLYLGQADAKQKAALFTRFFPKEAGDADSVVANRPPDETMAEFQGWLLQRR
jgi:chaperone BCS1